LQQTRQQPLGIFLVVGSGGVSEFGQQGGGGGDEVVAEGAIVEVETAEVREWAST